MTANLTAENQSSSVNTNAINPPQEKGQTIAVLGAGLAGLAAAQSLAGSGYQVEIHDSAAEVGGLARCFERNSKVYNIGPKALYNGGHFAKLLHALGISIQGSSPQGTQLLMDYQAQLSPIPSGPMGLIQAKGLSLRDKVSLVRLLLKLLNYNSHSPNNTPMSFKEWLDSVCDNENAKSILKMLAKLSTFSKASLDYAASSVIYQLQVAGEGVTYVDSGWGALIHEIRQKLEGMETRFQLSSTVKSLSDYEDYAGVIVAMPASALLKLREFGSFNYKVERQSVAALTVHLSSLPQPDRVFALGRDHDMYFSVHSRYAKMVDQGEMLYLQHYNSDNHDAEQLKDKMEKWLDRIQPGWRAVHIDSVYQPRLPIYQRLTKQGKTVFLGSETGEDVAKLNCPVFFAGQWNERSCYLADAAVKSGQLAAQKLLQTIAKS